MATENTTVLIMAAGTGGHIFPALSIAKKLEQLGVKIEWIGTHQGMENELLLNTGITLHPISVSGLKGMGVLRQLLAPFMISIAVWQAIQIIRIVRPDCVLGMGGFVSGPGGVAAKILRCPLLIHEQNAVAGLTNRLLSRFANYVFEAFPNTFKSNSRVLHTGNPLREAIVELNKLTDSVMSIERPLRILILGGSQGSASINKVIPEILSGWNQSAGLELWHQTGTQNFEETVAHYLRNGIVPTNTCRVEAFIKDIASAYSWADVVVCRSGASTVSEIAAVGIASILIPYPHHSDHQQLINARWLTENGAAVLLQESRLSVESLFQILNELNANRSKLQLMGQKAKSLAICDASDVIARKCLEAAHG